MSSRGAEMPNMPLEPTAGGSWLPRLKVSSARRRSAAGRWAALDGVFLVSPERTVTWLVLLASIASLSGLAACSLIRLDPVTAEKRQVAPITDEKKTVMLSEPIVWLDAPAYHAAKGVRLPQGLYTLEAEDDDYLYFRAPSPLEMRILQDGRPVEGPDIPGGLAIGKILFPMLSPVAYIDVDSDHKMLVMKLGFDFTQMRGKQWDQSF
jgi:hypothetical protein